MAKHGSLLLWQASVCDEAGAKGLGFKRQRLPVGGDSGVQRLVALES